MKKLLLIFSIIAIVSLGYGLHAQNITKKPENPVQKEKSRNKGSIGVLGGISMAGVQAEYIPVPGFGLRAVGLCIIGAEFNDMKRNEFILSGIAAPSSPPCTGNQ